MHAPRGGRRRALPALDPPALPGTAACRDRLRPGKLLKFNIGGGGIRFQGGQPVRPARHIALRGAACCHALLPLARRILDPSHRSLSLPGPLQVGADLHFAGPANQRRGRADSISKILFQHLARTQPISLQQLQAAAAASCEPAVGAQGSGDMAASLAAAGSLMSGSGADEAVGGGGSVAMEGAETLTEGIEVDG